MRYHVKYNLTGIIYFLVITLPLANVARGETFEYHAMNSVIGSIIETFSEQEQTLPDIARIHDLGYHEIKLANPEVDTWLPGDRQKIILPKNFILPVAKHEGYRG